MSKQQLQKLFEQASDSQHAVAEILEALINLEPENARYSAWWRAELNGYRKAIKYYLEAPEKSFHEGYMPDGTSTSRETPGVIKLRKTNGTLTDVNHSFANRQRYFVSVPIGLVEELSKSKDRLVSFELPELTEYLGKEQGGAIIFECDPSELQRIVKAIRLNVTACLDMLVNPEKQGLIDEFTQSQRRL